MTAAPRPTRAEAGDVANAVLDGTDCVMLSGETAAGPYPVDAVKLMASVCTEAEAYIDYPELFQKLMKQVPVPMPTTESLASSAVRAAQKVDAKLIITLARMGNTSRLVAKYKPQVPVLMMCIPRGDTPEDRVEAERVAHSGMCVRGIASIVSDKSLNSQLPKKHLEDAIAYAVKQGMCKKGDNIVGLHRVEDDDIMKIVTI